MNVLTLSISKAYHSKRFSTKANDLRLSHDMNLDDDNVSRIGGGSISISVIGDQHQSDESKSEVGDDTATFDIKKNKEKDDYSKYKEILENGIIIENNNNYLNTEVKSFFIIMITIIRVVNKI